MYNLLHLFLKTTASLLLLVILALPAQVLAQNYENFDNLPLGSTPGSGSYSGNSVPWYYYNCRGDVPMTGKAITLGVGGTTSSLTSYNLPPDIQTISFDLMQVGSGAATVFVLVDGEQVDALTTSVQGLTVNSGPISFSTAGVEEVEIVFITAEGGNEVALDNISWSVTYTPDNLETFDNLVAPIGNFEDGDFIGNNGLEWSYYRAMEGEIDGLAITLEENQGALMCDDIVNGMYTLSFDYTQTGSEGVYLDIYFNDDLVATIESNLQGQRTNTGQILVDIAGDDNMELRIKNYDGGEVTIDNIAWTNRAYTYSEFNGTGDWSDASKWSNGIPDKNFDAFIMGHATVDVEATAHYVGLEPQGTLDVGQDLLTSRTLTIRADATGSGSLIGPSSSMVLDYAIMNWHITSGVPNAWHLLSSPVKYQGLTGNSSQFTPPGSSYDFYAWDEPSEMWLNQKVSANNITSFILGKGYLVAYEDISANKFFASYEFNSGEVIIPVTAPGLPGKSSNGIYAGYNLIGNPYPSAIDWKDRTNLDKNALNYDNNGYNMYIWNDAVNNYGAYNDATTGDAGTNGVGRYIPPLQGFFVQAQITGNFIFNDGARVHSSQQHMKSGNQEGFRLSVTAPENAGKDEILLDFGHEGNHGGADKWYSLSEQAPSLYSSSDEKDYSIRFLNSVEDNPLIPVAFKAGLDGEYTITANFNTATFSSVKLKDLLSGNILDLNTNSEYTFTAVTGDDVNRFALVFGTLGIDKPMAESEIQVYAHAGILYLNRQMATPATIKVYNVTGQLVMEAKTGSNSLTTLNATHLGTGIYMVNVVTDEKVSSSKVAITN